MQKKFKLQKVLDYRALTLEREKAKLAELAAQERLIIVEVQRITEQIRQKLQEMADIQASGDFAMMQMYEKYITRLGTERRAALQQLAEHRQLVQKQKAQTTEAYKGKSIMDKLESRHKKAYAAFVETQEQKMLEDIVTTRLASVKE
ncbi:MAG: flagellar FliJ family protein [Deferribacteraceae bacterium]|jgi:flagellar export protein FliJ|nr:flagellar FliJ family protein [Deferribacteraceae bacterium]